MRKFQKTQTASLFCKSAFVPHVEMIGFQYGTETELNMTGQNMSAIIIMFNSVN